LITAPARPIQKAEHVFVTRAVAHHHEVDVGSAHLGCPWPATASHEHLIVDNDGTHTHPKVMGWLARHPRFHLHFTPTSASWLNLVERWCAALTARRIRRGSSTA
jgi:hypothetical protein